jgi:hypothetical protein
MRAFGRASLCGRTTREAVLRHREEAVSLSELLRISEAKLEPVFPSTLQSPKQSVPAFYV